MVKRHEKCTDFFLTLWQKTDRGRSSYCSFVTNKIIVRFLTSSDPAHSCNSLDSYHFMKLIQIKSWFLCFCRVCKAIRTLMRVHVLWLVLHILPCCLVLVIILNTDCPTIEYTVCKIEIFFNRQRIMWAPKGQATRGF